MSPSMGVLLAIASAILNANHDLPTPCLPVSNVMPTGNNSGITHSGLGLCIDNNASSGVISGAASDVKSG